MKVGHAVCAHQYLNIRRACCVRWFLGPTFHWSLSQSRAETPYYLDESALQSWSQLGPTFILCFV